MYVGDFGYRIPIEIQGLDADILSNISQLLIRVIRPDNSLFEKVLNPADKDVNGNFTWLLEAGELPIAGNYRIQAFDVTTGRRMGFSRQNFCVQNQL